MWINPVTVCLTCFGESNANVGRRLCRTHRHLQFSMGLHEKGLTQDLGVVVDCIITLASQIKNKPVVKAYLGAHYVLLRFGISCIRVGVE